MKKLLILLILCISTCLFASCRKETNSIDTDYDTISDAIADTGNQPNTSDAETKPSIIASDDVIENVEWPYTLEFQGLSSEEKPGGIGNLDTNYKFGKAQSCLVCSDSKNSCIYYVNCNKDNYIYQLKDGISSLLIEKDANCLQLWNNELYFLSGNNNINDPLMKTGDIYCYNLETKELRLILQANAISLYIDANGIFYQDVVDLNTRGFIGYRLDFGAATPQKMDYAWYYSYHEFFIHNTDKDISVSNRKTNDTIMLAPINYLARNINVCGDFFIFTKGSSIYLLNLTTGNKKNYNINKYGTGFDDISAINDYILINETLYMSVGNSIFKINTLNGEMSGYFNGPNNSSNSYSLLFTDGTKIYALDNHDLADSPRLLELEFGNDLVANQIITKELGQ